MGRSPKDVDCAAPRAADAAAVFVARTGGRKVCLAKHPIETWRVVFNGLDWDFTDLDGGTIEKDLGRRDFSIGAIALSVWKPHELRDPFGGTADIEAGIVRMISGANLLDDPLRMIRAVRLAGRLGFEIERDTRMFIQEHAERLRASAPERMTAEMDEILAGADVRRALDLLITLDLDGVVIEGGIDEQTVGRCAAVFSPDVVVRYAALFTGRESMVPAHAESSRWSTDRRRSVASLLDFTTAARVGAGTGEDALALLIHDYGIRCARRAVELLAAVGEAGLATRLSALVRERGAALGSLRPLLDGVELRELLGIGEGPEIGRLLRLLVEEQVRGTVRTRAEAEALVRREAAGA
jgi:tRNA nucleotidyltransferase (CCA-adding enzyme)